MHMTTRVLRSAVLSVIGLSIAMPLAAQPPATPPAAPTTAVLATLTVKAASRAEIQKVLPEEVRDTVRLYLDGKIQQWYARGDGNGVIFILNSTSVADAKAMTDRLPLVTAGLATFEFVPLMPLTPLRLLVTDASAKNER
jgi:hypothetical protein